MGDDTFRVLGDLLGEADGYVDVTIAGIDENGHLEFVDGSNGEYLLPYDEFEQNRGAGFIVPESKVGETAMWEAFDTVNQKRAANNPNADARLRDAQKQLFKAAWEDIRE